MCVVSMIFDYYRPKIDRWWEVNPEPINPQPLIPLPILPQLNQIEEFQRLVDEFKKALKAAKVVDKLTNQPDCEDPEKAKLLDRVAKLEKELEQLKKSKKIVKKKASTKKKK